MQSNLFSLLIGNKQTDKHQQNSCDDDMIRNVLVVYHGQYQHIIVINRLDTLQTVVIWLNGGKHRFAKIFNHFAILDRQTARQRDRMNVWKLNDALLGGNHL